MKLNKEQRNTMVSTLYEKCSNGEISVKQRERLLRKMNDSFITEAGLPEQCVDKKADEYSVLKTAGLSATEKYGKIKKVLYERCSNGEITVEQREELLARAKNDVFQD